MDHSSWNFGNTSTFVDFIVFSYLFPLFRTLSPKLGTRLTGTGQCWEFQQDKRTQGFQALHRLFLSHLLRKMNCAETTVRNKISKMTYLHIYFDSYGVTKFTKSQRFGWQVGLLVNSHILLIFFILGACWCLWRCCWSLHGVQPVKRS